jgi:hypothetical protein
MGIERVLKEKFGDAVKDIRQVLDEDQQPAETMPEVWEHRPPLTQPWLLFPNCLVDLCALIGYEYSVPAGGEQTPRHTAAGDRQLRRERGCASRRRRGLSREVPGHHECCVSPELEHCSVKIILYELCRRQQMR